MRMTFLCLVASMTIGAAALDWSQPGPRHPSTPGLLIAEAADIQNAIETATEKESVQSRWHAIEISGQNGDPETDKNQAHMVVDQTGFWSWTRNWRTQQALDHPGVIRVGIRTPAGSSRVSVRQWTAALRLTRILQQMCGIPQGKVFPSPSLVLPTK